MLNYRTFDSKMKKVLIIESSTHGGGSIISLGKLLEQINNTQYESTVILFSEKKIPSNIYLNSKKVIIINDPIITKDTNIKNKLASVTNKLLLKGLAPLFPVQLMKFLRRKTISDIEKVIKQEEIDIVITNTEPFRDISGIFAAINSKKTLIAFMRSKYAKNKISPSPKIINMLNNNVSTFLSVSHDTKKSWAEMFGINKNIIYCIHDYIEKKPFLPKTKIGKNLICIANIIPVKNYELLIRSTKKFLLENKDATLTIVGDGDINYVKKIKKLAHSEDALKNKIKFTGYIEKAHELIAKADFLLLLSHREGFPNVILEAMQSSTLIIASNVGGISEAIEHDVSGILIDPADEDSIYHNLSKLSKNKEMYDEITANALGVCNSNFMASDYKKKITYILKLSKDMDKSS